MSVESLRQMLRASLTQLPRLEGCVVARAQNALALQLQFAISASIVVVHQLPATFCHQKSFSFRLKSRFEKSRRTGKTEK